MCGGGIKRGRSATEPLFAVRESMRGGAMGLPLSEDALFGYFLGVTRKLQKSSSGKVIIYVYYFLVK